MFGNLQLLNILHNDISFSFVGIHFLFQCLRAQSFDFRQTDEPQSWVGYFGKALMTPSNYLPSQVTEVLAQERAFATIKLSHGGNLLTR